MKNSTEGLKNYWLLEARALPNVFYGTRWLRVPTIYQKSNNKPLVDWFINFLPEEFIYYSPL